MDVPRGGRLLLRAIQATLLAGRRGGLHQHQPQRAAAAAATATAAPLSTSAAPADGGGGGGVRRPGGGSRNSGSTGAAGQQQQPLPPQPPHRHQARRARSALAEPAARPGPLPRSRLAGQPTPATHPELLRPGELLPGVGAAELARRRAALAALLPPDSVAVVPAQAVSFVTGVIPHPYRQDADFAYLTGLQQQAVAVIATGPAAATGAATGRDGAAAAARMGGGRAPLSGSGPPPPSTPATPSFTFYLFVPQPDRERETWDGAWVGRDAAAEVFGADGRAGGGGGGGGAFFAHELASRLGPLVASARAVYFDLDRPGAYMYPQVRQVLEEVARRSSLQQQQHQHLQHQQRGGGAGGAGAGAPSAAAAASAFPAAAPRVHALRPLLHRLRWVKSPSEVALMAASASAAADAVAACMAATVPGGREASLAALFDYSCRLRGASRLAYPPVVASGADACTIHYSRNDKLLARGDLLLMDAGCELHGYASDVTRTWPVGGKFSGAQRALYSVVLATRARVLAAAVEGATLSRVHALCVSLLSQGLLDLGVLRGMSLDAVMAGPYKLSLFLFLFSSFFGLFLVGRRPLPPPHFRHLPPLLSLARPRARPHLSRASAPP